MKGDVSGYHQTPIQDHSLIENTFISTATHKIPPHMNGVTIDNQTDIKGTFSSQKIALEDSPTKIKASDFNENASVTTYLQENTRTKIILNNLPANTIP